MSRLQHVFDFQEQAEVPSATVAVFFGGDAFLKSLAVQRLVHSLGPDCEPVSVEAKASWREAADSLATRGLFAGPSTTLVRIRDADEFVQRHRSELESLAARPATGGLIAVEVSQLASNTRLYKTVVKSGIAVDCRPPSKGRDQWDLDRIGRWLQRRAEQSHGFALGAPAAKELIELSHGSVGLMDQELAKLSLFAGKRPVTADQVRKIVGGWRKKTAWDLIDAIAEGDAAEGLRQLDRLLKAGEAPQAIFGQLAWGLRRFGDAVTEVEIAEHSGRPIRLEEALERSGVRGWGQRKAVAQLRQITRRRGKQLHDWLLQTDLALKSTHSADDAARRVLEQLILRLSRSAAG